MKDLTQERNFSMSTMQWLLELLRIMRMPQGETVHSLKARLCTYEEAMEIYSDRMVKETLLGAARKFTFFPSVAELTDFLSGIESEKPIDRINAKVDTSSSWEVPTENRWWQANDWTKNLPKFGEDDLENIGILFASIVSRMKRSDDDQR